MILFFFLLVAPLLKVFNPETPIIDAEIPVDLSKIFWSDPFESDFDFPSNCNVTILLTPKRLQLYRTLIQEIENLFNKKKYQRFHLISGIQGIGKSNSLWLFAHLIKQNQNQNIQVVVIPDCRWLSTNSWIYVLHQFLPHFPHFAERIAKLLKKKCFNWDEHKLLIMSILDEFTSQGKIAILIVDQINSADADGFEVLKELIGGMFHWTLIIFTESTNNYNHQNREKSFRLFTRHVCNFFISEKEFTEILQKEAKKIVFKQNQEEKKEEIKVEDYPINDGWMKTIKSWTSTNPREGLRLLNSKGESMEEKIQSYYHVRGVEIEKDFLKFLTELQQDQKDKLYKSVYYMDFEGMFLESLADPIIDQRMMIAVNIGTVYSAYLWKINSAFHFANYILKRSCHLEQFSKTFYTQRKDELLHLILNPSLDPRMRGVCFEEFIHTTLNIYRKSNEKIGIFLCPSLYLNATSTPINYEV